MAALRHSRIAFIAGPHHLKSAMARRSAFQHAMAEIGLPSTLIVEGDHTLEGGMRALNELIGMRRKQPTAILCSNDMTAIGVLLPLLLDESSLQKNMDYLFIKRQP